MYADDTVVYMAIDKNFNPNTLKLYMDDLDRVGQWCNQYKLLVNTDKTQVMILGSSHALKSALSCPVIYLNNVSLSHTTTYKYLGVKLNPTLSLVEHSAQIIGMVTSKLNTLSHLRTYVGQSTALTIYKTTILPVLEYANVIHSLFSTAIRNKLQRLQNRALRIIYGYQIKLPISELHEQANLANLEIRANRQLTCLMYKRAHCSSIYPLMNNESVTRANLKIRFDLPRPTIERYKQFPLYHGAKLWDNLDYSIQRAENYELFKRQLTRGVAQIHNAHDANLSLIIVEE